MGKKFKVRVSLPRGEFDQGKASILLIASQFYAREILGTRLANLINLKVDVRKTTLEHNTLGVCHMAITGSKRQRKFRIVLNNRKDLHAQLETLAHEMVHVRQKAKNQLQYRWDRSGLNFKVRWMDNAPVRQSDIPYGERPWEIEARQLQRGYYKKFINHMQEVKNKMKEEG